MNRFFPLIICVAFLFSNSPAQWVSQNSGTPAELKDVVMLDSLTAITVGNWGTLLKTTNAGMTWVPKPGGGFNWNAVAFANPYHGIIVGENHIAKTTTDGGETWMDLSPGGSGDMIAAAFMGDVGVFIGTASRQITYSTDQGTPWNTFSLDENARSIFFNRGNVFSYTGYILTVRTMYKTSNSGITWTSRALPISNSGLALSAARSPNGTLFVAGLDIGMDVYPIILRQTISDSVWQTTNFETSFGGIFLRDVAAAGPLTAYACGTGGLTFKTTDDGLSWVRIPAPTTCGLNAVHFYNERRGIAVGEMGMILFTANGGITTDVNQEPTFPESVSLLQNYPNPFNPATNFEFRISQFEFVSLVVFDLLGHEVATLVNEKLGPGTYTRTFNGEGLSGGVYFYRLEVGRFVETKKLLLLK